MEDITNITEIDVATFMDMQGVEDNVTKIVLSKMYAKKSMSYDAWYELVKDNFLVSAKKDFSTPTPQD